MREEPHALEDVADAPAQQVRHLCARRLARNTHLAGVGLEQPVHDLEQRRLTRPRLADDRDELPGRHREIDPAYGRALAVREAYAREPNQRRRSVGVSHLAQRS